MTRLVRRLAPLLEREVPQFPRPKERLEQYRTPAELALEMASLLRGCETVVDLGAGTGMIAYAASLYNSVYTVALEVDAEAAEAARSSSLYGWSLVDVVVADASAPPLRGAGYCVATNPPFGVKRRGADRLFLEVAARLGASRIVSLHLASSGLEFVKEVLRGLGYRLAGAWEESFPIPQLYRRHAKRIHYTRVLLVLAERVGEED